MDSSRRCPPRSRNVWSWCPPRSRSASSACACDRGMAFWRGRSSAWIAASGGLPSMVARERSEGAFVPCASAAQGGPPTGPLDGARRRSSWVSEFVWGGGCGCGCLPPPGPGLFGGFLVAERCLAVCLAFPVSCGAVPVRGASLSWACSLRRAPLFGALVSWRVAGLTSQEACCGGSANESCGGLLGAAPRPTTALPWLPLSLATFVRSVGVCGAVVSGPSSSSLWMH